MDAPGLRFMIMMVTVSLLQACNVQQSPSLSPTVDAPELPHAYQDAQQYQQYYQQLLTADSLLSFDASVELSAAEETANQTLIRLRRDMLAHYDSIHFFPPARSFYSSKAHMYTTPLFAILKKMPKGGIHHLHGAVGGHFGWMIQRALQQPHCYVYWQTPNEQYVKGQIHFFSKEEVPDGFYPIQVLHDSIESFEAQLYDLLTFEEDVTKDSVDIWKEFENCFQRIEGFTSYQPVYEDLYTAIFDSLVADGVQHVELRTFLGGTLYDLEHTAGSYPYDSIIHYLQQAAQRVRNGSEPNFTLQLIYTNLRFQPLAMMKADLKKAYEVRQKYPDLVKGYDLVAKEDTGNPTRYYLDAWLMRDSLTKIYGIDMPLCLHDGESDWQHVTNLYDAILLHSTRIGHGFNLSFFPVVEEIVRTQNICIEVNPLSNQILGYIQDLRMHPAHHWINRGIQISISPDDPAIFDYVGVTPDYWSIFLAWELDLRSLKKLAINSIQYSLLNEDEKEKALGVWQEKWTHFIREFNQVYSFKK